mgnify:FL=1
MALDESDIQQISGLIATAFTEQLPQVMDKRLGDFLKQDVVAMVNGAKANTMGTLGEQLTAIKASMDELENASAGGGEQITADGLKASIKSVLEEVLTEKPGENPAGGKEGGNANGGFDPDVFKAELLKSFTEEHLKPLKQLVDSERTARETAEQGRQRLERQQAEQARDSNFIRSLVKTGQVDSDAGPLALAALLKGNHIKPSEDGSSYIVMGKDNYGIDDVEYSATEKIGDLIKVDELKYFRPARAGSGTNSTPASQPAGPATLQVLDDSATDGAIDNQSALKLMASDPDKLFADLETIHAS